MRFTITRLVLCLACALAVHPARAADDWNAYAISPASAPMLTLEAVDAGAADGTLVSIAKPTNAPSQKWIITPAPGSDLVAIHPAHAPALVLAIQKGGAANGTQAVLETDANQPWQRWSIKRTPDGTYNLIPGHTPDKGLDDFGGKQSPGARQDLWDLRPGDQHLQWTIRPLAGSPLPAVTESPSAYVAPTLKADEILQGQIKQTQFNDSKIFPGTTRDVAVFIPAQYDGSKPACVFVKFDGYNPTEKPLLEELIASKEMPVTIGVFVKPGTLPAPMNAPMNGTLGRRNRCFEYDGVGDDNVRFLLDELLPFVAKQFDLKLSNSGNDRCISGGSSGGIAAFTAAWHRPDAFSRVYAASGSFVAFRGGHEFPTLVRKTEAKPIRAFLTTGTHDMENAAGDWYLIDQEMDKALKFAGYDYVFRPLNGGHVVGYLDHFREAMAYLWHNYPEPVKAGPSAPRAQDVLLPGESWQLVAPNIHDVTAAAANAKGEIYFVDGQADVHGIVTSNLKRLTIDGKVESFADGIPMTNALAVGPKGELYAGTESGVERFDDPAKPTRIADDIHVESLLAMPNGSLYIGATGTLYLLKDGKKTVVDKGITVPAGLAYRPDQWLLAVTDANSRWAYSLQINPDGSLANKERFFWLHVDDRDDNANPRAAIYAREGQLLIATRMGVQICADDGPTQVILPLPANAPCVTLALGGPDRDTLFAFTPDRIYKRKLKVHALTPADPWTKVTGTKL